MLVGMRSALSSVVAWLGRRLGLEERAPPSGSVATFAEELVGQAPEPGLGVIVDWYRRDPYVRYAVDAYAGRVASKYYLTSSDPSVLMFLSRFLAATRFSLLNRWIARDVVLSGNAFLNIVPPARVSSLYLLPLSSITGIVRGGSGEPVSYAQSWGGAVRRIPAEEIHHYRFNPIDNAAFGEGLVNPLTRPGRGYSRKGRVLRRPSVLELKERIDNSARLLLEELPPFFVSRVPLGKRAEFSETYSQLLPGQHVVVDYDHFEVSSATVESRTRFAELWEYLDRQVLTGLKNPLVRLITYTGFSRASAEAALETLEPEIAAYQEFLSAEHERLLARVLRGYGYDAEAAELRWNWGSPEMPEWGIREVIDLYTAGIIERAEARLVLRELAGLIVNQGEREGAVGLSRRDGVYVLWRGRVHLLSGATLRFLGGGMRRDAEPG